MAAAPPSSASPGQGTQQAPYAVRLLQFTFQLGTGSFGASGYNQLTLGGQAGNLRAVAHVEFANAPATGMALFRIYGMTLDQMNQLSQAGLLYKVRNNKITVRAGDALSGMATIFSGIIIEAWPDFKQPDASFYVSAYPTATIQLKPVAPTSFSGPTPAATALGQIAKTAGLTLENNGVSAILQSPYFHGTAWNQLMSCVRAVDCFGFYDGIAGTFAVWPKTGNRSGGASVISPETGMIGYPSFQASTVKVRLLFNTQVSPSGPGRQIQVQSGLAAANGKFTVVDVQHDLSSELPDGPWETVITATPVRS